jgi:tRNA (guanine37-N1)-methyltransferase
MLRPPVNRAMRQLDRAFFRKTIAISAARIFNNQHISQCRQDLDKSQDLLRHERISTVQREPETEPGYSARKCLLLRPEIKHNGRYCVPQIQWKTLISLGRCLDME